MKILYLDPGLSVRQGHNAAMLVEFEEALVRERGHHLRVASSLALDPKTFADLGCVIDPVFGTDGYSRLPPMKAWQRSMIEPLLQQIVGELLRAGLLEADAILFPTMYPLHLAALAQVAERLRGRPLAVGFLMPLPFWCQDSQAVHFLGPVVHDAISTLAACASLRVYSETGSYALGDQVTHMATLIPPWASSRQALVQGLASSSFPDSGAYTVGFFGSPFSSKGVQLLSDVMTHIVAEQLFHGPKIVMRLPEGHEQLCSQLKDKLGIEASSAVLSNDAYLTEMSRVDVVWGLYDPTHYGDKMSGILPEAIALGKPVLVAEGCSAMLDFLERYAPGSFVSTGYDVSSLKEALLLNAVQWRPAWKCARQHAPVMRGLKSMDRFLAACGLT